MKLSFFCGYRAPLRHRMPVSRLKGLHLLAVASRVHQLRLPAQDVHIKICESLHLNATNIKNTLREAAHMRWSETPRESFFMNQLLEIQWRCQFHKTVCSYMFITKMIKLHRPDLTRASGFQCRQTVLPFYADVMIQIM